MLFIGNSFTIGSSAPVSEIFDRLAQAGGHDDPTTVIRAVGGRDYEFHATDPDSQAAITSRQWTHVILQNFSTEPTHIGSVEDHFTYGELLYDQVLANNPNTQIILFETWSRAANHALITGTSTPSSFESTAEMQSELRANYYALADSLNADHPGNPPVRVGPVGDAWERAGGLLAESDPGFTDLHGNDNYHGNNNGYFLAAAVFYSVVYGQSPEGLHAEPAFASLNLPLTEDPTFLEQVAWDVVNPDAEIVFARHPSSLTVAEHQPATFTAAVLGARPYTVQWCRDGEDIPGATELSYTIPDADSSLDGASFTVTVTNAVSSATSDPAVLTVETDSAPPEVGGTAAPDAGTITIGFSEAIAPLSGPGPAEFSVVSRGRHIPVESVSLSPDGTTVTLVLAEPITGNYAVGLGTGITDRSGNPVAVNTVVLGRSIHGVGQRFLMDFGASSSSTGVADDPVNRWNNVNGSVGTVNGATIDPLVPADGGTSNVRLEMVRRFNGANSSGTTAAANYPASASRDSLFGNTENFGSGANFFPAFRISNLSPRAPHTLVFYASRLSAGDNRETTYTITGAEVTTAVLNPANNVDGETTAESIFPDASGNILVEISPSPNNTNSNHFTYLGALTLTAGAAGGDTSALFPPISINGNIVLDWPGDGQLEFSDLTGEPWTAFDPAPAPPFAERMSLPARFFRLVR